VCSRIIETKISEYDTCWFPSQYLYRTKRLLHYTNLSYHNIFECDKLFNYNGGQAILNNCVLNKKGFNTQTNQVMLKLYNSKFFN
jgi:hypothetical protein